MTAPTQRGGAAEVPLPGFADERAGYRGPAVCRIADISYRQLDYWTTTGLVCPSIQDASGSGSQRLYAFEDIVVLKVIKGLLNTGVSLQRIRSAIDFVREQGLTLRNLTLLSDGSTVYAMDDEREIVDLIQRGQGVFAIAAEPLYDEVETEVATLRAEQGPAQTGASSDDQPGQEPQWDEDAAPASGQAISYVV
jgi:DNA-binding transcriptional MerR regulator